MKNKYLLNEKPIVELLSQNKIVVVDGGARGKVFPPLNQINTEIIKILRFEPEPDADIIHHANEDITFNKGLWHSKGKIDLNIAIEPSASSTYPFHVELQKHIDPHLKVRKTKKTIKIDVISLDELIKENNSLKIDFIKLDVHGAEYDVLKGANKVLESTLGLLIESWLIPIHKNQKIRAHVESLVYESGFYVFEEYKRANWARLKDRFSKSQTVAMDTLYFKDPILDKNIKDQTDAIKIIGFANLFNHNAYAVQLAEYFYKNKLIDKKYYEIIIKNINKNNRPILNSLVGKFEKVISRISSCSFR